MARKDTPLRRLKYRLLSHLPGARGLEYSRKLRRLLSPEAKAQFGAALAGARGKVCIDLGANMGIYTRQMAEAGARVYAFEPDPWTAAKLRQNLVGLDNVTVIEAAAATREGTMSLYRHPGFDDDPEFASLSSSTVAEKLNVDTDTAISVRAVDFPAFLAGLDADIAVIKMDIEGGEVALLEALLDHPVLSRIGAVFVETHENRVPALAARTRALRRRTAAMTRPVINMNWI